MESLELGLDVGGLDKIADAVGKAADAADRLADRTQKAGRAADYASGPFQRLARLQQQYSRAAIDQNVAGMRDAEHLIGQVQGRIARANEVPTEKTLRLPKPPPLERTMRLPKPPAYAQGPYQRLASLQREFAQAQGSGNGDAARDLSHLIGQQQRRIARIEEPAQQPLNWAGKAAQAFMTSRYGAGGLNPLVGRSLSVFGVNPTSVARGASSLAAGGVGGAGVATLGLAGLAAAAALAVVGVSKLAIESSRTAREFQAMRFGTGGTTGENAQLRGIGGALGMSGGDMTALAQSFQNRITSDPTAMAYASRMGVRNLGGPMGNQDYAGQLLRAINGLRRFQGQDRLRAARATGLESALPYTELSQGTMDRLGSTSAISARAFDPQQQRNAAEFQAAQSRAAQSSENFKAALGRNVLPKLTVMLHWFSDVLDGATNFLLAITGGSGGFNRAMGQTPAGTGSGGGALANAHQAQISATVANTEALLALGKMIGGGERARAAMPSDLAGYGLRRAVETQALRLGAI